MRDCGPAYRGGLAAGSLRIDAPACNDREDCRGGREGGEGVREIGDDPIVRCMERSGYPPWMLRDGVDNEERDEDRREDNDGEL